MNINIRETKGKPKAFFITTEILKVFHKVTAKAVVRLSNIPLLTFV